MTIYNEDSPALNDEFQGGEVALLAVHGSRVDKFFRQSYAWAKHAADAGKLDKITVVVAVDSTDHVHTVDAVKFALTGAALHSVAEFSVVPDSESYSRTAGQVREALKSLAPSVSVVEPELSPEPPVVPEPVEVVVADSDEAVFPVSVGRVSKKQTNEGDS